MVFLAGRHAITHASTLNPEVATDKGKESGEGGVQGSFGERLRQIRLPSSAMALSCVSSLVLAAFWTHTPPGLSGNPKLIDQSEAGAGNQAAAALAKRSPIVRSALRFLVHNTGKIKDPSLRQATLDILTNDKTCIRHRSGIGQNEKQTIIKQLLAEGLATIEQQANFPGGLMAGVFPPVIEAVGADGRSCAQPPQPFWAAPGGGGAGRPEHHAYPGGLAVHEGFVQLAAMALAQGYGKTYLSTDRDGLPVMRLPHESAGAQADGLVRSDALRAAPVWHDWSKVFATQWHSDGSIYRELVFGGNGATDAWGQRGDSRDRSHHILGLAEAMARGLAADIVITIAAAHGVPDPGNEYRTVNFLRTAAIIARIDPAAQGYLRRDEAGRWRLPPPRAPDNANVTAATPAGSHMLAEYALHQLGDADWSFSNPAAYDAEALLERLAPEFGCDTSDKAIYNLQFRNPALTFLTSERLAIVYGNLGLAGVRKELNNLHRKKLLPLTPSGQPRCDPTAQ